MNQAAKVTGTLLGIMILGLTALSASAVASDRAKTPEIKAQVRETRAQNQLQLEEKRQLKEQQRTAKETKRQEFRALVRERLTTQHQTIALRVAENLNNSNQNITKAYLRHLAALNNLLARVEDRITAAETRGADTTSARDALANSKTAIEEASGAIDLQATKEYVVEVTDTQTIGQALRTTVQELRTDHQAVRATIRAARETIRPILQALRDALPDAGENASESPSPAPSISPSVSPIPSPII